MNACKASCKGEVDLLAIATRPIKHVGFSLIELLVVMVLIGLLLAILVPALGAARNAARATACLSNLRQFGVLINAYLLESQGRLPNLKNRALVTDPGPALDTVFDVGETLRCPEDTADPTEAGTPGPLWHTSGTSYFWNFTVDGQPIDQLFSIAGGTDEARIPLLSDKEGFHPTLRDRINVLYADGRAGSELRFRAAAGDTLPETGDPP